MNVRDLQYFKVVAEELHFGRAAMKLHISQTSVSEAVARLERSIGGRLLNRSTRHVSLTQLGQEFLPLATGAIEAVVNAYGTARHIAALNEGHFVLGYSRDTAGTLLPLTRQLGRRGLAIKAMPSLLQFEALLRGRIHAGLTWEPTDHDALVATPLPPVPLGAILDADEQPPATLRWRSVCERPLVAWPRTIAPTMFDFLVDALPGGASQIAATASSMEDIAAHVIAGRGVGLLPSSLTDQRSLPGIEVRTLEDGPMVHEYLVTRRGEEHALLTELRTALGIDEPEDSRTES